MKKIFSIVAVVVMFVFSANFVFAAEEEVSKPEPIFSVSGELFVRSAYVGDDGGVYYRGFVAQPCVTISHNPTGLSVGVWGSVAPSQSPTSDNGEGNNFGDEFDLLAGWEKEIGKATINLDYAYYKLFPLNKWGQGDIHSVSVKVGYALTEKVNPYVKVIYDHVVDQTEQNGFIYRVGATFDLHEHLKIDASIGGHGPIFGAREEIVSSGKVSVSSPWKIGEVTIIPEVSYQKRFGHEVENGGLSEDILIASLGVTF